MGINNRIKPKLLAEKLAKIRNDLGITLDEMAQKLETPDIKLYKGTIYNYEIGKREPQLATLLAYARVANIYLDTLIDDEIDLPDKLPVKIKSEGIKRIQK